MTLLPKLPVPVPAPTPTRSSRAALSAIVVAGGRSSRLGGSPKALMRPDRDGAPALVRGAVDALIGLGLPAHRIAVVGPEGLPLPDGVLRTREDPPFSGPAAALAAGALALGPAEPPGPAPPPSPPNLKGRRSRRVRHCGPRRRPRRAVDPHPGLRHAPGRRRRSGPDRRDRGTGHEPSALPASEATDSGRTGTAPLEAPRGIVLSDRGILQPLAAVYRSAVLGRQLVDQPVVDRSVRRVLGPLWDRQTAVRGLTDDVDTWDDVKRFGLVPVQD
ncbi:NTP transferase domain-containing protein [Kocuria sp. SL71]|uniref:NTP transferase domain-containing protein n=1 Tax=Kocuria sp. SL71 TaxID=2995151 RepID=UPI002272EAFE|nr:NTP transferase domain-containing protein [Kocuria sp. SL71]MCY1685019.1 NTP transferase domain-containing protein [Kocuria sp. SL71]